MKNLFYLLIVVLILVFLYVQAQLAYLKINFSFRFISAQFNLQNLVELLSKGGTQTRVRLGATVINDNGFSFVIKDLSASLYYKQMLVAQTIEGSNQLSNIMVPANGSVEVIDDVTIFVNPASIELVQSVISLNKPIVDYTVTGKILGIKWTFSDNFVWE